MDTDIKKYMAQALLISEAYASAYEYMHDIKILMQNSRSNDDVVYAIGMVAIKAILEYLQTLQITD